MELRRYSRTGWPSVMKEADLARSIRGFTRADRVSAWKIGITNDPEARAKQYVAAGLKYEEMIVIYVSSSRDHVLELENWAITRWDDRLDNVSKGWSGARPKDGPHYVYLVIRRK